MTSVQRVYNQTMGLKTSRKRSIGPTTAIATRSGSAMPRRLGTRSAKTTNSEVTAATEPANASVAAVRSGNQFFSAAAK